MIDVDDAPLCLMTHADKLKRVEHVLKGIGTAAELAIDALSVIACPYGDCEHLQTTSKSSDAEHNCPSCSRKGELSARAFLDRLLLLSERPDYAQEFTRVLEGARAWRKANGKP